MSKVQFRADRQERTHSQRQTEPPLPSLWTTVCFESDKESYQQRDEKTDRQAIVGEAAFSGHCPSGRCVRKLVAGVREPKVSKGRAASKGRAKKGALTIECDEAWSFVGNKENQQWIWLAQDRVTREIVGCYIGARDDEGAIGLWQSLPECYLDAETYVDFWQAYDAIFYAKSLHHVGKESGQTNHIERFNNTLRQRVSRLVRKTLSFSKKLDNHLGAIWTFVHHHNQSLLL